MAWTQLPLGKASGKQGPAQGSARATHALGRVLPWGIRPALYLGCFETCFLLKPPHPELRQQTAKPPREECYHSTTFPFTFANILPFSCN